MEQREKVVVVVIALCFTFMVNCFPSSNQEWSPNKPRQYKRTRVGRGIYEFGQMITCLTNRTSLDYADYGCWCGLGGSGKPVDQLDSCCLTHDRCYDDIIARGICGYFSWQVYVRSYQYSGCTKCDPLSSYPSDDQYALCRTKLCECDSKAAICFNNSKFNPQNVNYNLTLCV